MIAISFWLKKSFVFLGMTVFIVFLYHVDAIFTQQYGSLFFSGTFPNVYMDEESLYVSVIIASLVVAGVSVLNVLMGSDTKVFSGDKHVLLPGYFLYFFILTGFVLVVSFRVFSEFDLSMILSNRQVFYSENYLAAVVLYIVPSVFFLAFFSVVHSPSVLLKFFMAVTLVLISIVAVFTGSRSTFILSAFLPCFVYYIINIVANGSKFGVGKYLIIAFVFVVVLVGSATYRDATRGEQDYVNLLVSPDFVALDSTVKVLQSDIDKKLTYASVFTFFVPRSYWEDKPVSGNHYLTSLLFPERFDNFTGAEITASLVGESFINFGYYGFLSAAVLVLVLIVVAEKGIRAGGLLMLFGLMCAFRGSNLLRGDLLNTFLPLLLSFFVLYFASRFLVRVERVF